MSLIGGYRYPAASSNSAPTTTIVNVGTMKISGLTDGAGLMCCLYSYNYATNKWLPHRWA